MAEGSEPSVNPADARRLHLRVHGRVQGVGFRWWTTRLARELGVAGTVRNLADGSVDIEAAAAAETLARFRASVAQGPPGASVRRVDELEPGGAELPSPFEIGH